MSFNCEMCNKQYSSYKSLWNHNQKFHKDDDNKMSTFVNTMSTQINTKCKFCEKVFTTRQSKNRHEKNYCKLKDDNNKIEELQQEVQQLKKMITKKINMTKNINKGHIINGNVINNIKIELGVEDMKLLSEDQKLKVLKSINYGEYPIVTLVDELYKNDKNRNIKISNLQNNIAFKYDNESEKFKATSKKQAINDIISVRKHDIKAFFEEFCNDKKMPYKTKQSIEKYIDKLFNSSEKNIELRKFINEHKEQIIFIIYNITLIDEESDDNSLEI